MAHLTRWDIIEPMDKHKLILAVIEALGKEAGELDASFKAAKQASVEAPGAMESHSDTTKFQMSQLAGNISDMLQQKELAIKTLTEFAESRKYEIGETGTVRFGSLVRAKIDGGEIKQYFVLPAGGGTRIQFGEKNVLVVSPPAPIAVALLNRKVGEKTELQLPAGKRVVEIMDIQ